MDEETGGAQQGRISHQKEGQAATSKIMQVNVTNV
jgi:hypothetical protein